MSDFKYADGDRIWYTIPQGSTSVIEGPGTVIGVADVGAPVIGRNFIIKPDFFVKNDTYPYSVFCAFEFMLRPYVDYDASKGYQIDGLKKDKSHLNVVK